jgi:hypothetical protein
LFIVVCIDGSLKDYVITNANRMLQFKFYLVYFDRKGSATGTTLFCKRVVDYTEG